jgi:Kinesin motor domain
VDHVVVQLESVLRLRPLLKKEKTDQIVLEPRRMEDGRLMSAVLHPMVATAKSSQHCESPAMKMLSPEMLHLCKDTEYHLDHIIGEECDQEKLYYSLGLPVARESMDLLKVKKSSKEFRQPSNLIVCMGVENSGKTHTCFGASQGYNISKRRSPEDGLMPRILDSLFSQSKHHVENKRNLTFGVKMSLIQVLQEKADPPKHDDDSIVQDLLLPTLTKKATSPMRSPSPSRLKSVKKLVATLERTRATVMPSSSTQHEALVTIDQDEFMEFVSNAIVKTCSDVSEARQLIASGLHVGQRYISRNRKAHILAVLQPILMAPDGSTQREGGKIGILDMAGIEQSSQKKRNAVHRHKDCVGAGSSQSDPALNAVLHCVRSLQHNSMILSGKAPALDIVDSAYSGITIDDDTSEISCVSQEKTGKAVGTSFKIVPYRQHNLTMLLQPFFSSRQTSSAKLTLLMAAYPGHRDHAEKKILLNDLELLFEVAREPEEGTALTGCGKRPLSPIQHSPSSTSSDTESIDYNRRGHVPKKPSKTFDKILREARPLHKAASYEKVENIVPLPPPYAPTAPPMMTSNIEKPTPSAPMVVDFPGVVMPSASDIDNLYGAPRGVMSNPMDIDRTFEEKQPFQVNPSLPLRPTNAHNIIQRPEVPSPYKSSSAQTKAWLSGLSDSTKSALNQVVHASTSVVHASTKKGMKIMDKMRLSPERPEVHHQMPAPPASFPSISEGSTGYIHSAVPYNVTGELVQRTESRPSESVSKRSPIKTANISQSQFKKMERENRELRERNKALERRCEAFASENYDLKRALELTGRKKEWTKEDEAEWNKKRREFAAPPLIQSPLSKHLIDTSRVFNTTGRYNFAIGRPHFSLSFPSDFRRASELDRRDREESDLNLCETTQSESEKCQSGLDKRYSGSGEKRKECNLTAFRKSIESVKRRRSSLIPAVRER